MGEIAGGGSFRPAGGWKWGRNPGKAPDFARCTGGIGRKAGAFAWIAWAEVAFAFADEAIPFADVALAFAHEAVAFANVAFAFANVTIALAKAAIAFANVTIAFAPEASAAADGATAFAHEAIPSWAVAVAKGVWRLGERRGMGRGGNPFAKIRSEALKQRFLASPEEGVKQEKTVFFDPCGRLDFAFCVKEKAFVEPIDHDALIRSLIFTFERKSD